MKIKILHTADNHLDPRIPMYQPKLMERRMDFWRAFRHVLDYAIKNKPDIFIISGDLYDRVNPRNPPRVQIVRYFRRLYNEGVRIFLIGGHHDTPRSEEEGASPLEELAATGYVTFFGSSKKFSCEYVKIGNVNVCVSGITYNVSLGQGSDPLSRSKPPTDGDVNIVMLHYSIEGFSSPNIGREPFVKLSSIPREIDYVAAGHLHRFQEVWRDKTYIAYPGSTERRSFAEEGDEEKGFLWVEIDSKGLKRRFLNVSTRPMKTLKYMVSKDSKSPTSEIVSYALKHRNKELILRLKIGGVLPLQALSKYRRDDILRSLMDHFFIVLIDDTELACLEEKIAPLPRLSPIEAYKQYMDRLAENVKDGERRKIIELAKEIGLQKLEEAEAW
ncbi:MAG: hypothetical protein DRJ44_05985 [Thermoprotei archaeon]|nr:MAG: hypothetical protein DRJ44_05985 [Thermoprotei archaeon]